MIAKSRVARALVLLVALGGLPACETVPGSDPRPAPCTPAWNDLVEARVGVLDADGHGPDIGSGEWFWAVDRKLGIGDGQGHGPDPGSAEWCAAVDRRVFGE